MSPAPSVSENLLPVETGVNSSKGPVRGLYFLKTGSLSAPLPGLAPVLLYRWLKKKKKKQISNRKESKPLLCLAELQLANTESVLLQNTAQPARAGNKDLALCTQHRGTDQEGEEQWGGEPSEKTHLVHQHYKPKFT